MQQTESATILLVEDDPMDQKVVKVSLNKQQIDTELHIADSGEDALDFLSDEKTPEPDLILLDLRMPGMGGKEFLRRIKEDDQLKKIPVVILTTSDSEQDIQDCYALQAGGYVKKPIDLAELTEVLEEICKYWFTVCKRPLKEE